MEPLEYSTTPTNRIGPGLTLHQARSELRLPVEEVARMLNLSPSHITALENDDYDSLFGPTYVRGYLRSYAQLLGLSADTIIESYNQLPLPTNSVALKQPAPVPQISSNDRIVKLATLVVVGVLLALTVIWWQSQEDAENRRIAASADRRPDAGSMPAAGSADGGSDRDASATSAPVLPPPTSAEALRQEVRVAAPGADGSGVAARGVAPVPPRSANTAPIASEVARPTASMTTVGQGEGAHARLIVYAAEDCWVDVRDANDNKLLYETVAAGRVVMLEGVPPFSVFLGNVDGIRIEYNGRPYDANRHKRGPIARFTLGVAEAVNN